MSAVEFQQIIAASLHLHLLFRFPIPQPLSRDVYCGLLVVD